MPTHHRHPLNAVRGEARCEAIIASRGIPGTPPRLTTSRCRKRASEERDGRMVCFDHLTYKLVKFVKKGVIA